MAERPEPGERSPREGTYRTDLFTLVAGIAAVLVSAYVLTDGTIPLPEVSGRWLLAGGAALIGLLMLLGSLRRKR